MKIYIHYNFQPLGKGHAGGQQFLKALKSEFIELKVFSESLKDADVVLFPANLNSKEMLKFKTSFPKKIFAHRTDGVYKLYNKGDKKDKRQDICFMLNRTVASCTIFQTNWAKDEHANFGLEIDKPFEIIGNAPDKKLFNTDFAKIESDKIRLVCTSWSINKNKGFPIYAKEYLLKSKFSSRNL